MFEEKFLATEQESDSIIESEKKQKTREGLLEEFKNSLREYGVEGVEVKLEGNKLVVEQKYGEGIRGLGYDKNKNSFWLCLDQKNPEESVKENQRWNANTILDLEKEFYGVNLEKIEEGKIKIEIAADHPVATLSALIGKEKDVYLPGGFNGWKMEKPLELNEETGKLEGELLWDGRPVECKIAIADIYIKWEDGNWENGANQKMETRLKPETEE